MPSATFDTVVCTFSLCAIPDHRKALDEMTRVATVPLGGEHFLRRPVEHVRAAGFRIERHDRFAARLLASAQYATGG